MATDGNRTGLSGKRRGRIAERAAAHAGLDLLILHGSRARGASHPRSDWDFGYLASAPLDLARLVADLVEATGCERVDVARLDSASGLLRFRAARDGIPVFERSPGTFERFWLDAVRFWLDAAPVLGSGYDDILDRLPR